MIYQYRCIMCGDTYDISKPMANAHVEEYCLRCHIIMNRVWTVPALQLMVLTPKEQDDIRAAKYERGADLICIGNDKKALSSVKQKFEEYTLPREVTSTFE